MASADSHSIGLFSGCPVLGRTRFSGGCGLLRRWDNLRLPELLLIGYLSESIWTPRSKSHILAISVLQFVLKRCQKRTQKESGEERVKAKSRPMMSLIARAPSTLSSSASESPGKRSYESQSPLSMQAEKYDGTEKPCVCPRRGAHAFQSRFFREHKHVILEEEPNHDRTEKPVVCPQRGAQQFVIGDDETELDLSFHESVVQRPAHKEWRWKNCRYTFVPIFAQLLL